MTTTSGRAKWFVVLLAAGWMLLRPAPAQVAIEAGITNAPAPADDRRTNGSLAPVGSAGTNGASPKASGRKEAAKAGAQKTTRRKSTRDRQAIVVIGKDAELKEDESAEAVVVIGGSAKVSGRVRNAVVVIGGDVDVEGDVGDAVVAVLGNVKAGPGASIRGDVVSVGGRIEVAEDAKVKGSTQEVELPGKWPLDKLDGVKKWLTQCVFKLRPLAPQVGWVWLVAGAFLLLYFLITLVLPRPVAACVEEMTRRPATTFLMGLLTKLLVPLVVLLLVVTGIGALVVPFVLAALLLAALLGKAALLQYLGRQIARQSGLEGWQRPIAAFLLGSILITLLYMIPVLGLLVFAVTGLWGTGAAVVAAFGGLRREAPERPAPAPVAPPTLPLASPHISPLAATTGLAPAVPTAVPGGTANPAGTPKPLAAPTPGQRQPPVIPEGIQTALPEALVLPGAGFWERMAAAFLDVVLIGLLSALVHAGPLALLAALADYVPPGLRHLVQPFLPLALLVALAYFAGLWTWRGTTVGGIVLNLKVVRHDGKPVNFTVALVRALAAAFSVIVLFLGFFWIAWSRDKQSWHDKIAGTVVVRQVRSLPLVCL